MEPGDVVFRHACKLGFEGIVSKRLGSPYISGRSRTWLKFKNPAAPAVKRRSIGGADCSRRRVQCGLTQNFDMRHRLSQAR
jgi:ATP-dependent DNA ligase